MDLKRVAKAMPWVVGIGLCLVEALKLLVQLDATGSKDAASGHTEPFLFAPAVSTRWSYVTDTQMWLLGVGLCVVLLLSAVMLALTVWNKVLDAREAAEKEQLAELTAGPVPRRAMPRAAGRGRFGRAG
jgi:hypothetical protein